MKDNKKVVYWLFTGCFLIFIMVIVGGITRLTDSGLSMTDYKLITETIPPLNEEAWIAEFERYKQFPEYQKLHSHFELEDFKEIYFWEWFHRVIGRLIGIVFIIPFLYFLFTKQLTSSTIKKALVLLALGAFQGLFGMVYGEKRTRRYACGESLSPCGTSCNCILNICIYILGGPGSYLSKKGNCKQSLSEPGEIGEW